MRLRFHFLNGNVKKQKDYFHFLNDTLPIITIIDTLEYHHERHH